MLKVKKNKVGEQFPCVCVYIFYKLPFKNWNDTLYNILGVYFVC